MNEFRFIRELEYRVARVLDIPSNSSRFRIIFSQESESIFIDKVWVLKTGGVKSRDQALMNIQKIEVVRIIKGGHIISPMVWALDFECLIENYLKENKIEDRKIRSMQYLFEAINWIYLQNARLHPLLILGTN